MAERATFRLKTGLAAGRATGMIRAIAIGRGVKAGRTNGWKGRVATGRARVGSGRHA